MSSDLSIGPVAQDPVIRASDAARSGVFASPPAGRTAPGTPNPTLRLDAALGLVVIEFLGKAGAVTTSIPSQRELAAYRDGTAQLPTAHPLPTLHHKV